MEIMLAVVFSLWFIASSSGLAQKDTESKELHKSIFCYQKAHTETAKGNCAQMPVGK